MLRRPKHSKNEVVAPEEEEEEKEDEEKDEEEEEKEEEYISCRERTVRKQKHFSYEV